MLSSQVGNEKVTATGLQELQAGGRGRGVPRLSWYKAEQEVCHLRGSGGEGLPKLQGGVWLAGISTGAISGRRKRALLSGRMGGQRPGGRKAQGVFGSFNVM